MKIEEIIIKYVQNLPEFEKAEVLDFIKYLKNKIEKNINQDWTDLSLSSAMRGMENEQTAYSIDDLKESYS